VSRGLFVDNHFEDLEPLLAAAAHQHGHSLQCARSPEEALVILRNALEPIRFIVMDTEFNNSSLRGLDALQAIHTAAPSANIVVLTGTDDADLRIAVECFRLGTIKYWSKQHLNSDRMIRDVSRAAQIQDKPAKCANSEQTVNQGAEAGPALYTDQFLDRYRTTFALRLKAVGVPEEDSGNHRAWLKKMLCGLLTPVWGRSLQLRYQILRKQECDLEFQIWILGFGWGVDVNEARDRSEHLWFDVALFSRLAEKLYTMETVTEEATVRNLLSSDSQGWCCWFEVLRDGRAVTFAPPKQVLSDALSSDLKQRLVIPFPIPENRSTLHLTCDLIRRQEATCKFVMNLRPRKLPDDLSDYLGALRRAIAAKWEVSSGPSKSPVTHSAGAGELTALASRLNVLQQSLSSHYEMTCCISVESREVDLALANLLAGEFFGPDPDVFEVRAVSNDRASAICGGSTEPALPSDLLVHRYALDEAQNIFRLPLPTEDGIPGVSTVPEKFAFVPEGLSEEGAVLGCKKGTRGESVIHFTQAARMQHLYVLGQSGTGKSSVLYRLICHDIEAGHGIALIDPHGDLTDDVLSIVPDSRVNDVVLVEPADCTHPVGLNVLEWDRNNPAERSFIIDELLRIFNALYNMEQCGGPMFQMYFRSACALAMADPNHPSKLEDVSRIFTDDSFRKRLITGAMDKRHKVFWEDMAAEVGGEASLRNMAPYIISKFDQMLYDEHLRPILNVRKSTIDFDRILNERKILILNAGKASVGQLSARTLGMFVVARLLTVAMRRVKLPLAQRLPFFLYVDEFQNFTTDSIFELAAEGRKFGIGLNLANQSLAQIDSAKRDALLGSISTVLAFRLGPMDAEFMAPYVGPRFSGRDLLEIPNYWAVARLSTQDGVTHPFAFQAADPVPPRDDQRLARLRDLCRERQAVVYAANHTDAATPAMGTGHVALSNAKVEFDVILASVGANRVDVVKVISEVMSLGLEEAIKLAASVPKAIKEGVSEEEARSIEEKFTDAGAKVEINPGG